MSKTAFKFPKFQDDLHTEFKSTLKKRDKVVMFPKTPIKERYHLNSVSFIIFLNLPSPKYIKTKFKTYKNIKNIIMY